MEPWILDWLHLVLRWAHLVIGAAWIGTSFYFVFLNNTLRPPSPARDGVDGELWAIHGGGYYHVNKLNPVMDRLPEPLHWFKWEAYTTWLTGVGLLIVVYYLGAEAYLVGDSGLSAGASVAVGVGTLVLGWLVYEGLCRSPLLYRPRLFAAVGLVGITAVAWALCQVLSPRAAYIHVGATLGTMMAGNVLVVIIPGQRAMVEATRAGRPVDTSHGKVAALRSLHNNYLTLPVLFVMVSNHFPATYGHAWNWALLVGVAVAGAGIRHWLNQQGQGRSNRWILPASLALLVGVAIASAPRAPAPSAGAGGGEDGVGFAEARAIIQSRCLPCHSTWPTHPAFPAPPLGIVYDTPEQIRDLAPKIRAVSVDSNVMPLANLTEMTDEERETLGRWIAAGASLD